MDKSEIAAACRAYLQQQQPGRQIGDSDNLLEDWLIDSLQIIEAVLFIESEFGIQLSRADINGSNFKSVAALSEFISARLSQ